MKKQKFAIIDANAIIHRAFHALPPLQNKQGALVNAVYGFATILLKVLKDIKPDFVAVCFDVDKETFRKKMYKEYKAQRERAPQELYDQIEMVRELVRAFNMSVYEKEGFEADDVIGTINQQVNKTIKQTNNKTINANKNLEILIMTGDLDALQLVDENTKVYILKKGIADTLIYDIKGVKDRFGFGPGQMVGYKALRGDASDNIPGVRGVGEKTATTLIQEFGTLENIYKFVDKSTENTKTPVCAGRQKHKNTKTQSVETPQRGNSEQGKRTDMQEVTNASHKENGASNLQGKKQVHQTQIKDSVLKKLKENKKEAFLSKELARIREDVKIGFEIEDCRIKEFDMESIVRLFQEWNFKTLISKIPQAEKQIVGKQSSLFEQSVGTGHVGTERNVAVPTDKDFTIRKGYTLIDSQDKFDKFLSELKKQKEFAVDTETDGKDPFQAKLIGISFCWEEGRAWYLPVKSKIQKDENESLPITHYPLLFGDSQSNKKNLKALVKILNNKDVGKIGHNIKFDMEVLGQAGFELRGIVFDTMVASYLLNPGTRQHGLDAVVFTELGHQMIPIKDLIGEGRNQILMSQVDVKRVADYSCEDADYTFRLYKKLVSKLREVNLEGLMDKIETPLIPVLARVESNGVKINVKFLERMSKKLGGQIKELETKIYRKAGTKFNVRSPIQLKEVLFEKMGISTHGLSRTKTGVSTAAGELDKLKGVHPIIDLIMEHRELSKLKNTYTDALPKLVNPKTGRVHASFNQTVTATGRLSSSDPNLQNIPIRTDLGAKIREAFVAEKGYKIVAADYSQIELRVAASLAGDKNMLEAFEKDEDIHIRTAAEVCGVDIKDVTPKQRGIAKRVNFGILYGQGARGLSQQAGIPYDEAVEFIEKYFEVYQDIKNYMEETVALAHSMGYVENLLGRRRYLPEINAEHQQMRSAAERMAVNHPMQSTAADLLKLAMIEIDELIGKEFKGGEVKMVLTVHDELVFEVKEGLVKKVAKMIQEAMETVYKLRVPLKVDVGVGKSWGEAK